jgi:hypothetical protein
MMATSADMLCRYSHQAFRQFTEAVVNLKFDEELMYDAYIRLFEGLCGLCSTRPIQTLVPPKVGQKRQRDPNDEIFLDSTGAPKKKVRFRLLPRSGSQSTMRIGR